MNLFTEYELKSQIIDVITEIGYQNPTEIQKLTIPFLLKEKRDLIALAQTGTGKTAAFGLPLIHQIDENAKYTQAIVLCPTRELCMQISRDISTYASKINKIRSLAIYGGANIIPQINELKKQPQIIIGTPGRLNDMIRRKIMNLSKIQWIILDEADEMLSMGFKNELETILLQTPHKKQTLLFSATMNKSVEKIARGYMNNPYKIVVSSINSIKNNISYLYCITKHNQKLQVLHRVLDAHPDNYSIIFCRTRIETQEVSDYLMLQGFSSDALHGDLSQAQRDTVMKKFHHKNLNILVATDVASRGLDVNNLTHVIHFSIPDDPEIFIHRSGRTGRAGKFGQSISLTRIDELRKLRNIEREYSIRITPMNIPSNEEIIQTQINKITEKITSNELLSSGFKISTFPDLSAITKEDLFKKFIFLYLNNILKYYKKHPTICNEHYLNHSKYLIKKGECLSSNKKLKTKKVIWKRKITNESFKNKNYTRFFINLGKYDYFSKVDIINMINNNIKSRIDIGKIDIHDKCSFFEIESKFKNEILKIMNNSFNGKPVNIKQTN